MSEREVLAAEVEPWLQQCGSCDAGLPMGCTCPKGDYRNVLLKVWQAYLAATRPAGPIVPDSATCDHDNVEADRFGAMQCTHCGLVF